MSEVTISPRAYLKMIFHAAKYPHCAVNGILLASREKTKNVVVIDAVPLFHQCLHVTPMAEVALVQVEAMASHEDLQIVGYYAGAENFYDNTIEKAPGARIADKIAENCNVNACFIILDNKSFSLNMDKPAIKLWQFIDSHWIKTNFSLSQSTATLDAISALLKRGAMKDLIDFDNYLDNTDNDWQNSHLNMDFNKLLAMY